LAIAVYITVKLPLPEVSVPAGIASMLGTAMPEAAIHKDRESAARKCDVGSDPKIV
jgi:hypothetical protein